MAVLFNEPFTGTAGTNVTAHAPTVGTWGGTTTGEALPVLTDANRARGIGSFFAASGAYTADLGVTDFDITAELTVKTADSIGGITFRHSGTNTYYQWLYNGSTPMMEFTKCVSGSFTTIQSASFRFSAGDVVTIRARAVGTSFMCWVNNRLLVNATDSSITTGGRIGIRFAANAGSDSNTAGVHVDNLVASSIVANSSGGYGIGTYGSTTYGASVAADTTPPLVTITSGPTATTISRISGFNTSDIQFTANEAIQAWQVRRVPATSSIVTAGTLLESGGAVSSGATVSVNVTDSELLAATGAEGSNILKVFAQDLAGNWSTA